MRLPDGSKQELLDALLDPVYFIQLCMNFSDRPVRLDTWQVAVGHDHSRLFAAEKAPQIGMSWFWAMEALWEALLFEDSNIAFVSVDQREASNKIAYARKAYDELPEVFKQWVPMVKASVESLQFGSEARPSTIRSIPASSALRGWALTSLYLDEIDFYKDGGYDVFRVALGRITRGGRLRMASTCYGHDTILDSVVRRAGDAAATAKNFSISRLPYTVAENEEAQFSIELARDELRPEEFLEEYCCVRGGASESSFGFDLMQKAMRQADPPLALDELSPRTRYAAGLDVGGTTHPSVFSVFKDDGHDAWQQVALERPVEDDGKPLRLPNLVQYVNKALKRLPRMVVAIDAQGIGLAPAQELEDTWGDRVRPIHPSGYTKDAENPTSRYQMALALKHRLEAETLGLLVDKEQQDQFRRTSLLEGGKVDQPGTKRKTHYDAFWATAYALLAMMQANPESVYNRKELVVVGLGGGRRGGFEW